MRFRTKFGLLGWCWVAVAMIWVYLVFFARHRSSALKFSDCLIILLALQNVFSHFLIYWELDSFSLRERRFWKTREIPWEEVTHVGSFDPRQPWSDTLVVDYARAAPMSDSGRIVARPEDRQQFIAALRRFAPSADFDV